MTRAAVVLLLSCVLEELVMLRARYRHGEPLRVRVVLPSAYHHWQWMMKRKTEEQP